MYISGGVGNVSDEAFRDVWRFNMPTKTWTKLDMKLRKKLYFHATAVANVSICCLEMMIVLINMPRSNWRVSDNT